MQHQGDDLRGIATRVENMAERAVSEMRDIACRIESGDIQANARLVAMLMAWMEFTAKDETGGFRSIRAETESLLKEFK